MSQGLIYIPGSDGNTTGGSAGNGEGFSALTPAMHAGRAGMQKIEAIADAGFHCLEIGTGKEEVLSGERMKGLGLTALKKDLRTLDQSVGAISCVSDIASQSSSERKEAIKRLVGVMEACESLGSHRIVVNATVGSSEAGNEHWRYLLDSLYDMDAAGGAPVSLSLEAGMSPNCALREANTCESCLREAPENTDIALSGSFFSAQENDSGQRILKQSGHIIIEATKTAQNFAALSDAGCMSDMARGLSGEAAGKIIAVRCDDADLDRQDYLNIYNQVLMGILPVK